MALIGIEDSNIRADVESAREIERSSGAATIIAAIVILLVYQGYSLSIIGVASPWIAKSFALDQARLAELFAWMSLSAFGTLILARLADRVGRRRIILASLVLAPLCAGGAAVGAPILGHLHFRDFDFRVAWGFSFVGDRSAGRGTPGRTARSGAGVRSQRECHWGRARLYRDSLPAPGRILVAMAAGALHRRNRPGAPAEPHAAGRLGMGAAWFEDSVSGSHFYDVFHPLYRRRAITLLVCAALDTVAGSAVNGWLYFDAVSIIGLSPQKASSLIVVGMVVGMLGFPAGAWTFRSFRPRADGDVRGRRSLAWSFGLLLGSAERSDLAFDLAARRLLLVQDRLRRYDGWCEFRCNRIVPLRAAHHDDRMAGDHRRRVFDASAES